MKITRSETKLVVADFPWLFSICFTIFPLAFFAWLASKYVNGDMPEANSIIMFCIVASVFLVIGIWIAQRSVFSFDRANRELTWSRVSLWGHKGGTVPFSQIKEAVIESSSDSRGGTTYRMALTLIDGELPLTFVYTTGEGARDTQICREINELLGVAPSVETRNENDIIRDLIDSGRLIDAIQRVRDIRQCSLAEAKKIAEGMRRQA